MAKKKTRTGGGRAEKKRRRAARASKLRGSSGQQLASWPGGLDVPGWYTGPGGVACASGFCGVCEDCAAFIALVEAEIEFDPGCDCAACAEAMDTSGCPVAGTCAGCGETAGLRAVTAAFDVPAGVPFVDVACATLCGACAESGSFTRRVGLAGLDRALFRHARHRARVAVPGPRPDGPGMLPG